MDWSKEVEKGILYNLFSTYFFTLGFFLYIEASPPRKLGDKARLESPFISDHNVTSVEFWYHMYGLGVNTLNVYIQRSGEDELAWNSVGK